MKIYIALPFLLALAGSAANAVNAADVEKSATSAQVIAFSALSPGQPLPKQFRPITLPKIASNRFSLVDDDGKTVLRVDSDNSAGSLGLPLSTSPLANALLEWRWKIGRVLDKADMTTKAGDDFAARVYVFFDVPIQSLSFGDRTKQRLARMIGGADVPTAAICYVWDNTHRVGRTQWSAYTDRVRMIVLQSGAANANRWMSESRDINADFREAFGFDAPAVTGVAVGNDTDNTGERMTTRYGDVALKTK